MRARQTLCNTRAGNLFAHNFETINLQSPPGSCVALWMVCVLWVLLHPLRVALGGRRIALLAHALVLQWGPAVGIGGRRWCVCGLANSAGVGRTLLCTSPLATAPTSQSWARNAPLTTLPGTSSSAAPLRRAATEVHCWAARPHFHLLPRHGASMLHSEHEFIFGDGRTGRRRQLVGPQVPLVGVQVDGGEGVVPSQELARGLGAQKPPQMGM